MANSIGAGRRYHASSVSCGGSLSFTKPQSSRKLLFTEPRQSAAQKVQLLLLIKRLNIVQGGKKVKGKYLRRTGAWALSLLMLAGIGFAAARTAAAQQRRVIIVRQYPYRFYRSHWGYPYGFNRYDPWSPYGSYYRHYIFSNSESALSQGYKDGFSTGKSDGRKAKSFNFERSHYFQEAGFGNFAEIYRSGFARGYRDGYRLNNSRIG